MKPPSSSRKPGVLIIVENLPVPFDRRVWQEATALNEAGFAVSVICPKREGYTAAFEVIDGIEVHRHGLPLEASGLSGFVVEYASALFWEFVLSWKIFFRRRFSIIHACNPPDLIFLIALPFKLLGVKFIFDHHDIMPELFEAKFGRQRLMHRLLVGLERLTFLCADASIATNASFKAIAIDRDGMRPDRVWIVKSYPDLRRFGRIDADPSLRRGARYLIGYVGIIGDQDGVDHLLRAMAHIVGTRGRDDVHCLIIGDGPALSGLKALAQDLDLGAAVTFAGYLRGDDLLRHPSSLDAGVVPDPPNPYNDKISMNKIFEYMALGIPFVLYDLSESRAIAAEAGRIAAENTPAGLGEAVLALLADEAARRAMSAAGRARALKSFDWQLEKRALIEAYQTVLGGTTPR